MPIIYLFAWIKNSTQKTRLASLSKIAVIVDITVTRGKRLRGMIPVARAVSRHSAIHFDKRVKCEMLHRARNTKGGSHERIGEREF